MTQGKCQIGFWFASELSRRRVVLSTMAAVAKSRMSWMSFVGCLLDLLIKNTSRDIAIAMPLANIQIGNKPDSAPCQLIPPANQIKRTTVIRKASYFVKFHVSNITDYWSSDATCAVVENLCASRGATFKYRFTKKVISPVAMIRRCSALLTAPSQEEK